MISIHVLQVRYQNTPQALETAREMLLYKCSNMRRVLTRAIERRRSATDRVRLNIQKAISDISISIQSLECAWSKARLFLAEARATKLYWSAFRLLVHAPEDWHRKYPHAHDPWNQALNIGYTVLMQKIRAMILRAGMDTEVGILHASKRGKDALAYDCMEMFRQSIVDISVLRLFSRDTDPEAVDPKHVIREIGIRGLRVCLYKKQRITRERAMQREIEELRNAIIRSEVFHPTRIRL